MDRSWEKLSNVLFHEFGDLVRVLLGYQSRGELSKGF